MKLFKEKFLTQKIMNLESSGKLTRERSLMVMVKSGSVVRATGQAMFLYSRFWSRIARTLVSILKTNKKLCK